MVVIPSNLPTPLEFKIALSNEQFWQLCQDNPEWQFERTATAELTIMSPTGGITSDRNAEIAYQLRAWSRQNNLGKTFDSNGGFILPNGAIRAPDASWLEQTRWDALTPQQQERFPPLCPDFVVELMSPQDSLERTRAKLQEYIDNGAQLGWLINPRQQQVEIYRRDRPIEILDRPTTVPGDPVLPGFVLDLTPIW